MITENISPDLPVYTLWKVSFGTDGRFWRKFIHSLQAFDLVDAERSFRSKGWIPEETGPDYYLILMK